MTNALAKDDHGVLLRQALKNARIERDSDIQTSGDLRLSKRRLPKNRAKRSETVQSNPENSLALTPGINTIWG
jgi:hypothetical protein